MLKLIFWLLGALFVVMTTLAGATANHVVSQNDTMLDRISKIEQLLAAEQTDEMEIKRRLDVLENRVYGTMPRR